MAWPYVSEVAAAQDGGQQAVRGLEIVVAGRQARRGLVVHAARELHQSAERFVVQQLVPLPGATARCQMKLFGIKWTTF